jgi:hypothetical protein
MRKKGKCKIEFSPKILRRVQKEQRYRMAFTILNEQDVTKKLMKTLADR